MMQGQLETYKHINEVRRRLRYVIENFLHRAEEHDRSKLESPEVEIFEEFTPKLKNLTYGSPEYKECLARMKPALDHHYANNTHHPEFWVNGIKDMSLLDLLEMLCDWDAASKRHADGSILKSIEINQERFKYGDELKKILLNTAQELGMDG
jgi:hypothetical protein